MHIIQIEPLAKGVYNDHCSRSITVPPEGWAMIPEDMEKPSTFPRLGSLEVEPITYTYEVPVERKNEETGEIEIVTERRERVIMTVTAMTEGTLPEVVEVEPEPTSDDILNVLLGVE
jgi:hypothetical protein